MARHALRGEMSLYFWGQRYLGSLDALLAAPFVSLLGSVGAIRWPNVVLPALTTLAWAELLRRRWGTSVAVAAALVLALPGWPTLMWLVTGRMPFGTMTALGTVALLLADRPSPEVRRDRLRLAACGAALGLGLWVYSLSVVYVIALAVVWLLSSPEWERLRERLGAGAMVLGALLGLATVGALFVDGCEPRTAFLTISVVARALLGGCAAALMAALLLVTRRRRELMGSAGVLLFGMALGSAPQWIGFVYGMPPTTGLLPSCPSDIVERAGFLLGQLLPNALGLPPIAVYWAAGPSEALIWSAPGLILAVALGSFLWRERGVLGRIVSLTPLAERQRLPAIVALLFLVPIVLALAGRNASDNLSTRYLIVTWQASSVLIALFVVWLARRVPTAGRIVLALWLLQVGLGESVVRTVDYGQRSHVRTMADVGELERYLADRNVRFGWGDYWTAYGLTLLTEERLLIAPFNFVDRYPDYTAVVRGSDTQVYVLPAGYFPVPASANRADQLADALATESVGGPPSPWAIEQMRRQRVVDRTHIALWDVWVLANP